MLSPKIFIDKNSPYIFIIRFLGCFLILYYFYNFYRGLTGVGGGMYSPFLDKYLNLVKGLTGFLTGSTKVLLNLLGYNPLQKNYHSLQIEYSRGISVNPSCLGWGVMSFWVAFVFAHTNTWLFKAKWMIAGVAAIMLLNIVRIALIVLANYHNWSLIKSLEPHATFNVLSYGCIFLLILFYIRVQKKYDRLKSSSFKKEHQFITV